MGSIGGQSSGDYLLNQGALRILYSVIKDSEAVLSPDGFTQNNPNVVTTTSAKSTTIPINVKRGVLVDRLHSPDPTSARILLVGRFWFPELTFRTPVLSVSSSMMRLAISMRTPLQSALASVLTFVVGLAETRFTRRRFRPPLVAARLVPISLIPLGVSSTPVLTVC